MSYTNKEETMNRNSMKIRNKITGEVASGVVEVDNPCVGWEFRYKDGSCRITYYRTHWEPVEEWVKIEVLKRDWDLLNKSTHHSGLRMFEGVRYRYTK